MARISIRVANRLRTTGHVLASARTHRHTVLGGLVARQGVDEGALGTTLDQLSEWLREGGQALRAAEHAYVAEQADDAPARAVRDGAAAGLHARVQQVQDAVDTTLGDAGRARFGLEGPTPRVPLQLADYARNAAELLRASQETVANELGVTLDTGKAAAVLDAARAPLDDALGAVATEARELEVALSERDRALEAWSEVYQGVASCLEGLYRLAGEPELARRIRPTARRQRGDVAAADDPQTEDAARTPTTDDTLVEDPGLLA